VIQLRWRHYSLGPAVQSLSSERQTPKQARIDCIMIDTLTLLRDGIGAAKAGNKALARQLLRELTTHDPNHETAWLWLGGVAEVPQEALRCLEQVLHINPNNAQAKQGLRSMRLRAGIADAKAGNRVGARRHLLAVTQEDSANELAWIWLAGVAETPQNAVYCLQRVLELNPNNTQAAEGLKSTRLQAGIGEARAGDKEAARRYLRPLVEQCPESQLGWLWLAAVAENPADALDCFQRVLSINPNNERARTGLRNAQLQAGIAAAQSGNKESARSLLTALTQEEPANELAWHWRATVCDDPHEAIACLQSVLDINPDNVRARSELEQLQKDLVAAVQAWQCPLCQFADHKAATVCPDCGAVLSLADPEVFFGGSGSTDAVKLREAITRLNGVEDAENSFDTQLHLGLAHLNLRDFDQSLDCFKAALRLRTGDRQERARLTKLVQRVADAQAAAEEKTRQVLASRRCVLVVDDSPTVRKLVTLTMEKNGYRVAEAADGEEALASIRKEVPDLVLLDITMPKLDGYQVCKLIRSNPETARVPVIMLSGKDGFFDKVRGRMAGSTRYLTKPFKPENLLEVAHQSCPHQV
jgi:twitching motility two-component system response regulator PilG